MICTWEGCDKTATHPQKANDGTEWSNLCDVHHELIEDAMTSGDVKKLLSRWVKAQGGAKAAARRMR